MQRVTKNRIVIGLLALVVVVSCGRKRKDEGKSAVKAPEAKNEMEKGTSSSEFPQFKTLEEAVTFIAARLDGSDYERLANAARGTRSDPASDDFFTLRSLHEKHKETALQERYKGRTFPSAGSSFKLGGHAKELGHIHIDFHRNNGSWELENIWLCR